MQNRYMAILALLEPSVLPPLFYPIRTAPTLEHDPLFYKRHPQLNEARNALEHNRSSATDLYNHCSPSVLQRQLQLLSTLRTT
jgi:hypothetical protein